MLAVAAAASALTAAAAVPAKGATLSPAAQSERVIRRRKGKRYYDPATQPRESHGGLDKRSARAAARRKQRAQRTPATELEVTRVARAEAKRQRKAARRATEGSHNGR